MSDSRGDPRSAVMVTDLVKDYPRPGGGVTSFFLPWWKQDSVRALDGVSFEVEGGSIFGLLGTNGAGKTTLIKIACGLILPTSGGVEVLGLDPLRQQRKVRSRVGLVTSEERSFYWRISGRRNLDFFAALHGMEPSARSHRIEELGELLGISEYLDVPFSDYSTGMRQKTDLARSLLHDPEVLFMDEPTRSLSPEAAYPLQDFIRKRLVEERSKTVFMATQDMSEAERLCDNVGVVHRGRLLYLGPLASLIEDGRRKLGEGAALGDIFVSLVGEGEDAA
ncbi:MAG: ABC transporter ATP-binding protein [Actinomycetota bacterium]|nr:ABC transporter ATP-binding protein [Actinomycetota bacterium]